MKKEYVFLFSFLTILILSSCSSKIIVYDVNDSAINDYLSSFYMGELGTLPLSCRIDSVKSIEDSVLISGYTYDEQTGEKFPSDIWLGNFIEKIYPNGYKTEWPQNRIKLGSTLDDGKFTIKFKLQKDDVIFFHQISYYPAVFKIYEFINSQNKITH